MARILLLLSMHEEFELKFINMVHNVNAINGDATVPVIIEARKIMEEGDLAAIPKKKESL